MKRRLNQGVQIVENKRTKQSPPPTSPLPSCIINIVRDYKGEHPSDHDRDGLLLIRTLLKLVVHPANPPRGYLPLDAAKMYTRAGMLNPHCDMSERSKRLCFKVAIQSDQPAMVTWFLQRDSTLFPTTDKNRALLMSLRNQSVETANMMKNDHGLTLDLKDSFWFAVREGHDRDVQWLIKEYELTVALPTALLVATKFKRWNVVNCLLDNGVEEITTMLSICRHGRVAEMRKLITGLSNKLNMRGFTNDLIKRAVRSGSLEMLQLILSQSEWLDSNFLNIAKTEANRNKDMREWLQSL